MLEKAGKLYARVSYKQAMDIHDMAHHMAEHSTDFSLGIDQFCAQKSFSCEIFLQKEW